jgi:hypothetical protein
MDAQFNRFFNEGIDMAGGFAIDLLPTNSLLKSSLKNGLDLATDVIFDPDKGEAVTLADHSELQALAANLVPVVLGLIRAHVLEPVDLPFVTGDNERLFEEGLLLQIKALLLQAIENFASTQS